MKQDMTHNMDKDIVRMTAMTARIVLTGLIVLLTGGNAAAEDQQGVRVGGSVYGGGNAADVGVDTEVNIGTGTIDHDVFGGVYGGGDESAVDGSTQVNLQGNATVNGNVFGGGNNGVVSGSATVNIVEQ